MMFEVTKNTIMPYKTAFTAMLCKVNVLILFNKKSKRKTMVGDKVIRNRVLKKMSTRNTRFNTYH